MSWLSRLFGREEEEKAKQAENKQAVKNAQGSDQPAIDQSQGLIPPERMGVDGKYDESGLAKRVALAFDEHPELSDLESVWVAQTGKKVVLKGKVKDEKTLESLVTTARGVYGTEDVDIQEMSVISTPKNQLL
ncbi:MAG: phospholipid-binding protein [Limnospira sp.]